MFGGSYHVGYEVARSLIGEGYAVFLCGLGAPSSAELSVKYPGIGPLRVLKPCVDLSKISILTPFFPQMLAYFERMLEPDIVWTDTDLYARSKTRNQKIVEYIHGLSEAVTGGISPKYERGLWRVYGRAYLEVYRKKSRRNPFQEANRVVANSNYTASLVEKMWGEMPRVIYPPTDNSYFECREGDRNGVITVARIAWDKRIEDLIFACAGVPVSIKVVGAISDPHCHLMLRRTVEKLGLRVQWFNRVSDEVLRRELCSAKVFVSTGTETFGLNVVEAMASGVPVIVRKSGAPYWDILAGGKYGLGYDTIGQLREQVIRLLSDENEWRHYSQLGTERARAFDVTIFRKEILQIVGELE